VFDEFSIGLIDMNGMIPHVRSTRTNRSKRTDEMPFEHCSFEEFEECVIEQNEQNEGFLYIMYFRDEITQ
jgi:hypothetical protein